jgi:DNA-binding transcriptional ArsR family regulator
MRRPPEIDKYVDAFLSTVCDPSRRFILELLATPDPETGEKEVARRSGDIAKAINLSAATTSEHLGQLTKAGLVISRRRGNTVYYQLSNHDLVQAFHTLIKALDDDYKLNQDEKLRPQDQD